MDVSDRRLQVQLTQEAKIATDFHFIKAIFAVVGFVSAMGAGRLSRPFYLCAEKAARRFLPDETIARAHDGDPDAAGRFFTGTALIPAPIHAIMDGKWRKMP